PVPDGVHGEGISDYGYGFKRAFQSLSEDKIKKLVVAWVGGNDHGGLPLSDQPRQSTRRRAIEPDVRFDDSGPVESVESCLPEMRQVIDHGKVAFRDQLIDPTVGLKKSVADQNLGFRRLEINSLPNIASRGVMTFAEAGGEDQKRLHSQFFRLKKITIAIAMHAIVPTQRRYPKGQFNSGMFQGCS